LKRRLELGLRPHPSVMSARAYGILPRNALHGEDGEGERETRPGRETRANAQDRTKLC